MRKIGRKVNHKKCMAFIPSVQDQLQIQNWEGMGAGLASDLTSSATAAISTITRYQVHYTTWSTFHYQMLWFYYWIELLTTPTE